MNRLCLQYGITDLDMLGELAYDSYQENEPQATVTPWRHLTQPERDRWNLVGETLTVSALLIANKLVEKTVNRLKVAYG